MYAEETALLLPLHVEAQMAVARCFSLGGLVKGMTGLGFPTICVGLPPRDRTVGDGAPLRSSGGWRSRAATAPPQSRKGAESHGTNRQAPKMGFHVARP